MKAPARPRDERYRQAALDGLGLVDTLPERDFDAVVALGRALFGVPICLVTLIDNERQWFKARVGLAPAETPRDISFCGHAILKDEVFVVLDAAADPRFHDNPLVTGSPFIRFYAGAPIRLPSGYRIGTVCVIAPTPRAAFDERERALLMSLADLTLNAITIRVLRRKMDESVAESMRYRAIAHTTPTPVALVDRHGVVEEANEAFAALCGKPPEGKRVSDVLPLARNAWTPTLMARRNINDMTVVLKPKPPARTKTGKAKTKSKARTKVAPPPAVTLRILRDAAGFVFVGT